MKKLALVIPAALILSGCTLFPSKTSSITGTEAQKAEKLGQIISSGGQADCLITNLTDKTTTQIIVSGKKMKFVGSDFGGGKKGSMISDGVYTYVWTDGEKTGFKTKIEPEVSPTPTVAGKPEGEVEVTNPSQAAETFEDETKFQTECVKRKISDSDFTPPADVKFTDFAELMKAVPQIPSIPSLPGGDGE